MVSAAGNCCLQFLSSLKSSRCKTPNDYLRHRDVIAKACETSNFLKQNRPTLSEFETFLQDSHDFHLESDSVVKSALFRVIRLSMGTLANGVHGSEALKKQGRAFVDALIKFEWQWIIIASMEREPLEDSDSGYDDRGGDGEVIRQDFVLERMQSLKLVRLVLKYAPEAFPLAFARSLVAISENVKDNIRRVSLETLRELCVLNPRMAVASEAFNTLLDAVFDPSFSDMIESIVNTILFMLSNPLSRRMLRPHLDLRALIAPFTDVDARESDALPKLTAAKTALVTIMKSWTGVVLLVSDDLGLPTLIRMLRDSKVPVKAQELLLDVIAEVFEPIFAKVRRSRLNTTTRNGGYERVILDDETVFDSDGTYRPSAPSAQATPLTSGRRRNATTNSNEHDDSTRAISPSVVGANNGTNTTNRSTTGKNTKRPSLLGALFGRGSSAQESADAIPAPSPQQPRRGSGGFFEALKSGRRSSKGQLSDGASLTGLGMGVKPPQSQTNSSPGGGGSSSSSGSSSSGRSRHSSTGSSGTVTPSNTNNHGGDEHFWNQRLNAGRSNTVDSFAGTSSGDDADASNAHMVGVDTFTDNVLYNLMDNHAAMLCSSLLHSEIVESLCYLGTRGTPHIADKSRVLLVEFLRTLAHILPEQNCAELLNAPSLIEFSTSIHAGGMTNRAHKARQLLSSLADAFSVAPRHFRVSPTGVRDHAGLSLLAARNRGFQVNNPEDGAHFNTGSVHSGVSGERIPSSKDEGSFYLFQFTGSNDADANELGQLPLCAAGEHLKHFVDPMVRGAFLRGGGGSELGLGSSQSWRRGSIRRITSKGEAILDPGTGLGGGDSSHRTDLSSIQSVYGSGGNDVAVPQMEAIRQLRLVSSATNPHLSDFNKLMDASRVLGKDAKSVFHWDWAVIYETLEYSFSNNISRANAMYEHSSGKSSGSHVSFGKGVKGSSDGENHLLQALNKAEGKWIKRIAGFYRCSSGEGGFFAQIPWDLANLTYVECGVSLYRLLTIDPIGQEQILKNNFQARRFKMLHEIATELKSVLDSVEKQPQRSRFGGLAFSRGFSGGRGTVDNPLVFRLHSMKTLQARDYFNILGRLVRHPAAQSLMDQTDLFRNLSMLGGYLQLDYLSRIVITSLVFNDHGFMSKHLIRIWTSGNPRAPNANPKAADNSQEGMETEEGRREGGRERSASKLSSQPITGRGRGRCSLGLRNYIYNLLGSLLSSQPEEFYLWGVEAVVEMIVWEQPGCVSLHLLRLLLQIVQRVKGLLLLIEKLECVRYHPLEDDSRRSSGSGAHSTASSGSGTPRLPDTVTGFDLTTDEAYHPVLVYFLSIPRGIAYCTNGKGPRRDRDRDRDRDGEEEQEGGQERGDEEEEERGSWLSRILTTFQQKGAQKFVFDQELCLARALSPNYVKRELCPQPGLTPIPFLTKDLSSTYTNTVIAPSLVNKDESITDAIHSHNASQEKVFLVKATPAAGLRRPSMARNISGDKYTPGINAEGSFERQAGHTQAIESRVRESEVIDLEGMLRIPWNIEVKTTDNGTGGTGGGVGLPSGRKSEQPYSSSSSNKGNAADYLRVDPYLDTSDLALPSSGGIISDLNRFVKVRGVILGPDGCPLGKEIPATTAVHIALMAGRIPIGKAGQLRGVSAAHSMAQMQQEELTRHNEADNISFALGKEGLSDGGSLDDSKGEGRNPILMAPEDLPATQYLDSMYEWTSCLPQHRVAASKDSIRELGNDRFSVHIPGEPCKFIFSRVRPTAASYEDFRLDTNSGSSHGSRKDAAVTASGALQMSGNRSSNMGGRRDSQTQARRKSISKNDSTSASAAEDTRSAESSPRTAAGRVGGNGSGSGHDSSNNHRAQSVYLLEVQYYISMLSGQSLFAVQPPHAYGMLSRSLTGCALLSTHGIVKELVGTMDALTQHTDDITVMTNSTSFPSSSSSSSYAFAPDAEAEAEAGPVVVSVHDYSLHCSRLKEVLWSLGQIASTDLGFQLIEKATEELRTDRVRQRKAARMKARSRLGKGFRDDGNGDSGGIHTKHGWEQGRETKGEGASPSLPLPPGSASASGAPDTVRTASSPLAPPPQPSTQAEAEAEAEAKAKAETSPAPLSLVLPGSENTPGAGADAGAGSREQGKPDTPFETTDTYEQHSPQGLPPRGSTTAELLERDREDQEDEAVSLFQFLPWCLRYVTEHSHYGVRSAIFRVLGLVSRSPLGRIELTKNKWESSSMGCTSAVTVPKNHSVLFQRNLDEEAAFRAYASAIKTAISLPTQARLRANPAAVRSGVLEVLSVLSGMQSLPISSENKLRLEALRKEHAKAFQYRDTYLAVQELLGQCRFRLVDRRVVNNLFPLEVRLLSPTTGADRPA